MTLKDFLKRASKHERADVAVVCNDSIGYLYQLAGGHRFASPHLAVQIEHMTQCIAQTSQGRLEMVPRQTLVRHPEIFNGLDL
ncbi:MAG: hypothetical protein K0U68_06635 [Gammaproteobacteria bacterium]|nr:hypothetical protein [Gammaproteobacteria bacterium]